MSLSTPSGRQKAADSVHEWSLIALQAMSGEVGVIKPQIALYEQMGSAGLAALEDIVDRAKGGFLVLMDAKEATSALQPSLCKALLDDDGLLGPTLSPSRPISGAIPWRRS